VSLSFAGKIILTQPQVFPEFDKLHRRTIYVDAYDGRERSVNRPCVWLRMILQPEELQFEAVEDSDGWDAREQRIFGVSGRGFKGVGQQVVFGNSASRSVFKVVVYLEDLSQYTYQDSGSKQQLRYKTWCKLIESPPTREFESLFESLFVLPEFDAYMDEINRESLDTKEYTTTLGLPGRVTVQAALGLEVFLGRKEFILTITIHRGADEEGNASS
jgi:hypothetical protein